MEKHARLKQFRAFCARSGIELLRDDVVFIDTRLNHIAKNDFKPVLTRYTEEWLQGLQKVPKTQGAARRRANLWLLNHTQGNGRT